MLVSALSVVCQQPTPSPTPAAASTPEHERIAKTDVPGQRFELKSLAGAVLYASPKLDKNSHVPLIIHFHGPGWLVEYQIAHHMPRAALITVQLGTGSSVYNKPFDKTDTFRVMLEEARSLLGLRYDWSSINLTAWSAGYGAVRAILRDDANFARVNGVLLLDGIHASYSPEGRSLADGGVINQTDLDSYLKFAREAVVGRKRFVITHSEIVPGTYASTTECTNYLLTTLGIKRRPSAHDGPMSLHQLTAADAGSFHIRGYAGTTAADHVDQIHAMSNWLKLLKVK
jgi:hypothetical protein